MSGGGMASKINVIAPHRNAAILVAKQMKLPDRDWIWVKSHLMLKGQREMQIIEVWSLRKFVCLEEDRTWASEYNAILRDALMMMEAGRVATYCRVLFP
jgi:hypothetical protein